jgi:hypothetical protein
MSKYFITSIFQNLQYWYYQYFPESAILVLPVFSRIFQYLQYWYYQYFPESSGIYTGYTSIADIGRLGRIPVNPSFYVYIIVKELNIIHTHTSCKTHNAGSSSILHPAILVILVLYQYCRYWKIR